jgi:hypothetical protein
MTKEHGQGGGHGGGASKVQITVVVNGVPVDIEQNENSPLEAIIGRALEQTGNVGQPVENWELRDEQGVLLDAERKIETYGFGPAVTLFLSLKAGVGGC